MTQKELIEKLRLLTGAGISDCLKAAKDSNGDPNVATALLDQRGQCRARSYENRTTKAGHLGMYLHHNGQMGAMVVLSCETDFVAKMPTFQTLASHVALHVSAMNPSSLEELLKQEYVLNPETTIEQLLLSFSASCKEKISIKAFQKLEV